jgi:hypothetical protein
MQRRSFACSAARRAPEPSATWRGEQAAEKYKKEGDNASADASLGIAQIYFEMGTEAQCWFPAVKHPPKTPPVSGNLPRVGTSLSAKA